MAVQFVLVTFSNTKQCYDIENWLKNRRQRVVINGESSEWVDINSGVAQGSIHYIYK